MKPVNIILSLITLIIRSVAVNGQGCYWNTSYNSNTNGGNVQSGITNVGTCEQNCLNAPPCNAVDFNSNGDSAGNYCWFSQPGSAVNYGSAQGITHYNYVCPSSSGVSNFVTNPGASNFATNPGAVVTSPVGGYVTGPSIGCGWNASANSNSFGGVAQPQITSLQNCQYSCLLNSSVCLGVDWDPTNINGKFCWFSVTPIISYGLVAGVTHYQYVCSGAISSSPGCWNMSMNSYSPSGTTTSATSLSNCQSSCKALSGCYGIDWNPINTGSNNCWLSTNSVVLYGAAPGIYHFNYICSGEKAAISGIVLVSLQLLTYLSKMMTSR